MSYGYHFLSQVFSKAAGLKLFRSKHLFRRVHALIKNICSLCKKNSIFGHLLVFYGLQYRLVYSIACACAPYLIKKMSGGAEVPKDPLLYFYVINAGACSKGGYGTKRKPAGQLSRSAVPLQRRPTLKQPPVRYVPL